MLPLRSRLKLLSLQMASRHVDVRCADVTAFLFLRGIQQVLGCQYVSSIRRLDREPLEPNNASSKQSWLQLLQQLLGKLLRLLTLPQQCPLRQSHPHPLPEAHTSPQWSPTRSLHVSILNAEWSHLLAAYFYMQAKEACASQFCE